MRILSRKDAGLAGASGWIPLAALTLLLVGCSDASDTLDLPQVTPSTAAGALVTIADTDGDSALSPVEIDKIPAVKWAAADIDRNADKKLTSDEINAHIEEKWQPGRLKLIPFAVRIELDGKPLAGAEVEFEPVEALAKQLSSARGTSDQRGMVAPMITSDSLAAGHTGPRGQMQPGFYSVRVSHPTRFIPPRYQQSALGIEGRPPRLDGVAGIKTSIAVGAANDSRRMRGNLMKCDAEIQTSRM